MPAMANATRALCSAGSCRAAGVWQAEWLRVCLYAGEIPFLRGLQHTNGKQQYVEIIYCLWYLLLPRLDHLFLF